MRSSHPKVCTRCSSDTNNFALIMAFAERQTLLEQLKVLGRLPDNAAVIESGPVRTSFFLLLPYTPNIATAYTH